MARLDDQPPERNTKILRVEWHRVRLVPVIEVGADLNPDALRASIDLGKAQDDSPWESAAIELHPELLLNLAVLTPTSASHKGSLTARERSGKSMP